VVEQHDGGESPRHVRQVLRLEVGNLRYGRLRDRLHELVVLNGKLGKCPGSVRHILCFVVRKLRKRLGGDSIEQWLVPYDEHRESPRRVGQGLVLELRGARCGNTLRSSKQRAVQKHEPRKCPGGISNAPSLLATRAFLDEQHHPRSQASEAPLGLQGRGCLRALKLGDAVKRGDSSNRPKLVEIPLTHGEDLGRASANKDLITQVQTSLVHFDSRLIRLPYLGELPRGSCRTHLDEAGVALLPARRRAIRFAKSSEATGASHCILLRGGVGGRDRVG